MKSKNWNRKGMGEILMFFAFIFLWLIVSAGIVIGVTGFYGNAHDFREIEAQQLAEVVGECLSETKNFFEKDIYVTCGLNKNVIEDGDHAVVIRKDGEILMAKGIVDFEQQCFFEGSRENENYPKCYIEKVTINGAEFEILAGSNQKLRRVLV